MRLNLVTLVVSVGLSWYAAVTFGFAGAAAGSVIVMYIDRIATLRHVALHSGVAFRRLQDWRSLGLLLLSAALAALLAWCIAGLYFGTSAPLVRLAVGGAVLAAGYAAVAALLGVGRNWLSAMRNFRRSPSGP